MQHTNTSSTSGGSTTSLFYRDLGARWLTTRSKKGIRRSNKNRLTLSKTPIFGWWRPAWNLSFEARVGILALVTGSGRAALQPRYRLEPRCSSSSTSILRTDSAVGSVVRRTPHWSTYSVSVSVDETTSTATYIQHSWTITETTKGQIPPSSV